MRTMRGWCVVLGLVWAMTGMAHGLVLEFSTYFGGSKDVNFCADVGTDSSGRIYAVGVTNSDDLPTTNALQSARAGGKDGFLFCYDPATSNLVYATYLGGTDEDVPTALLVADDGTVFVTGFTRSVDFPVVNALQPVKAGGSDAFLMQIDPTGTNIVFSTYYGGGATDEAYDLARDAAGNFYLTGYTESGGFPVVNAFQSTRLGTRDAFVAKLLAGGVTIGYSTYLGGSSDEIGLGIDVTGDGSVVVTGGTFSGDFPTKNPVQSSRGGRQDAFVTRFNPAGSALVFSTYLGGGNQFGTAENSGTAVTFDANENVYVVGNTTSSSFPVSNAYDDSFNGVVDTFLVRYGPAGTTVLYSTYYGGNLGDFARDVAVATNGYVVITGQTASTNLPSEDPLQDGLAGGTDAFLTVFGPAGASVVFATYLGGKKDDGPLRFSLAEDATVTMAGVTASSDFPLVYPIQSSLPGSQAGFVAQIIPITTHDLAIQKLKAPKKVTLKTGQTPKASKANVQLINLSHHDEVVPSMTVLSNLVWLAVESLGDCADPVAVVQPPASFPIIWPANGKLKVNFQITFTCANDPLQGAGHEDYQIVATVNHAALGTGVDTNPENDVCPRPPSGADKGCGNKTATGTLGAEVLTDVVVK